MEPKPRTDYQQKLQSAVSQSHSVSQIIREGIRERGLNIDGKLLKIHPNLVRGQEAGYGSPWFEPCIVRNTHQQRHRIGPEMGFVAKPNAAV